MGKALKILSKIVEPPSPMPC